MKHLLIIASILLLSSPVIGNSHGGETLYLKDGKKNGQGTLTFSWGGKDEGEYKDGKQNGQGTDTYPSGSMYVCEWKDTKMKHLLILISFLLLSSPVIGDNHKGETLYGCITSTSTLEWKTYGEKVTHPIYKGDVENGKPSGLGVITFPDGSKFVGEYKHRFL